MQYADGSGFVVAMFTVEKGSTAKVSAAFPLAILVGGASDRGVIGCHLV